MKDFFEFLQLFGIALGISLALVFSMLFLSFLSLEAYDIWKLCRECMKREKAEGLTNEPPAPRPGSFRVIDGNKVEQLKRKERIG